jgi:transmembrane sensor
MNERLTYLFGRYTARQSSIEEDSEFFALAQQPENREELEALIDALLESVEGTAMSAESIQSTLEVIFNAGKGKIVPLEPGYTKSIRKRFWQRVAVAAAIFILIGSGAAYYLWNRQNNIEIANKQPIKIINDVAAPAKNRATIMLSNGKQVFLDSSANGILAAEGKTSIQKLADNQIAYNANGEIKNNSKASNDKGSNNKQPNNTIAYNTLTNPRGSRPISILLADGTIVWLNTESSLKYPVAFSGNERKVEITGEAYFEVAHDAKKPFIVTKAQTSITVLGTHFNVDAYDDNESIKVTLLEGSVEVTANKTKTATAGAKAANNQKDTNNSQSVTIKPGEQAKIKNSQISVSASIDVDQVMAWKNNKFSFDNTNLEAILKEFSRWYDVKVVYENKIPDRKFFGIMNRSSSLATVLGELQANNIKFELEGKTLTVK